MDTLLIAQTNNEIMKELLECLKNVRYALHSEEDADGYAYLYTEFSVEQLIRADAIIERAPKWVAAEGK